MANVTLPDEESVEKEMQRQNECEETKELEKPREVSHERKRADAQRNPHVIKPKADKYEMFGADNRRLWRNSLWISSFTLKAEPMGESWSRPHTPEMDVWMFLAAAKI